ncbi:hypothetical protein MNBD_BACTEROID07-1758 [hydrothermal vent metagenome]|uniref:Uncharacterized protein n=1 Tax=hydrothermal vent metagenome TaxID=652676 RepID=A0A3B0VBW3_9ZZZZ
MNGISIVSDTNPLLTADTGFEKIPQLKLILLEF